MKKHTVLVFGMGGIGTVCALALEQGGKAEVTAVMRSNYEYVLEHGIDIHSIQYGDHIRCWRPTRIIKTVPDVSGDNTTEYDFILVTTKNIPDVPPSIADIIAPAVTPHKTVIVLAQNGLNIEKPLIARFPANAIISSVVFTGASQVSLGFVHHSDPDIQKIGPFSNQQIPAKVAEDAALRYIKLYNPYGKQEIFLDCDIAGARWRKLAYNSSFNSVSAILRMDTSRLRMSKHLIDDLVLPIILEIRAAAAASGVTLQKDLVDAVVHQDIADSYFKPSMCQDAEKQNLMEVENIVGEPLREGEALGVPMPTLRFVYSVLKGLQLQVKEAKGLWGPRFEPDNPYF